MTTVVLTIIGGTLVFCLSQWLLKFIFEPAQELKKSIGEVTYCLIYHANYYSNPTVIDRGALLKASDEFRQRASRLLAAANSLGKFRYKFLNLLGYKPSSFSDVCKAASLLIGIANNLGNFSVPEVSGGQESNRLTIRGIREDAEKIESFLGIASR